METPQPNYGTRAIEALRYNLDCPVFFNVLPMRCTRALLHFGSFEMRPLGSGSNPRPPAQRRSLNISGHRISVLRISTSFNRMSCVFLIPTRLLDVRVCSVISTALFVSLDVAPYLMLRRAALFVSVDVDGAT